MKLAIDTETTGPDLPKIHELNGTIRDIDRQRKKDKARLLKKAIILRSKGLTYRQIAKRLNRSWHAIQAWLTPGMREKRTIDNKIRQARKKRERHKHYLSRRGLTTSILNAEKDGHTPCSASFEEVKNARNGKCHCCGISEKELKVNLHLDHDHKTGKFRGWLCGHCNTAIGLLGDDIKGVRRAYNYLKRGKCR